MDFQDKNHHWISMLEASRLCAYSQEYLSLLARRGKIFSKKLGRNWYTTREAVDDYLKTQSVFNIFKNALHFDKSPKFLNTLVF